MKFVILKSYLEQGLATVSKAISGSNPRVILQGVKLELNGNGLLLTGSDSYISIVTKIPLKKDEKDIITVFDEGTAVIGARNFAEVVRKFGGERLEIEMIDHNILKIKDDISDFSLNCMESEDYPQIDLEISGGKFTLPAETVCSAINQTAYAASDKETRPILQGVNLKANGTNLEFVATDSFRIAKKTLSTISSLPFSVTIPAKIIQDIGRLAETSEAVEITVSDKKVLFRFGLTLVGTNLINGQYPDTTRLIPQSFESKLVAKADKLITSIDRTSTLSNDRNSVVRISLGNDEVKIMSRTQETGSGKDFLQDFEYTGPRLDISFTARYLIDAIKSFGDETVVISFNGDSNPAILTSQKDNSVLALILPVRTY